LTPLVSTSSRNSNVGFATFVTRTSSSVGELSGTLLSSPTETSHSDNNDTATKKLAIGLGLGLGLPILAIASFFCCSYRKISISIKWSGPEPPLPYEPPLEQAKVQNEPITPKSNGQKWKKPLK
jgi:hypothetical protein